MGHHGTFTYGRL
jgi:hypothetical protein